MGLKSFAAKWLARREKSKVELWLKKPQYAQNETLSYLTSVLETTDFGIDHGITSNTNYDQWKTLVPLRDYEALYPYVERILEGELNVL